MQSDCASVEKNVDISLDTFVKDLAEKNNELAKSFIDKDSILLEKIHVVFLNYLLLDVEREMWGVFTSIQK